VSVQAFNALWGGLLKMAIVAILATVAYVSFHLSRSRWKDRYARAALNSERYASLASLSAGQAAVIDAMITELASRPETYSTFPPDLQAQLSAAHDRARELERKRS
jgi:Tfp pilus assembly protein PilE